MSTMSMGFREILTLLIFLFIVNGSPVAKFEVSSVDSRSIVIRMLYAPNVTRFDMEVVIYDLDKLREFRRTALSTSSYQDQLFSFDGLTSGTWFAIRIEYRLVYKSRMDGHREFNTKQELIVHTKSEDEVDQLSNRSNLASFTMNSGVLHQVADGLIQLEGIVTDSNHINVTLTSIFPIRAKITTLIVPELFCERGFIKPPAQRLHHRRTHIHFDLKKLHEVQRNPNKPLSCNRLCIYPFIRAQIGANLESFRGHEWCGTSKKLMKSLEQLIQCGPEIRRYHKKYQKV